MMGVKVAIFLALSMVLGVMVFDLIMKIANLRFAIGTRPRPEIQDNQSNQDCEDNNGTTNKPYPNWQTKQPSEENKQYRECSGERGPYPEALPTLARHIARILSRSFRRGQPHARRTS